MGWLAGQAQGVSGAAPGRSGGGPGRLRPSRGRRPRRRRAHQQDPRGDGEGPINPLPFGPAARYHPREGTPRSAADARRARPGPAAQERRVELSLTATVYHVDLSRGTIETKILPEDVYRKYPGGSALAAYLVLQSMPAGADPLGPDNVLVMAVSPLTGLAISGQSRMTACARSPLTGAIGDSQCGGFFPAEMRAAGADAIVFTGESKQPVYLYLNDGHAELRPAGHLWGKVTAEVDQLLKDEVGDPKAEVAQIGPAGENRVRFAAIMNMVNRANGRTGLGAVMGAKRLKAVVVRGTKPPKPAHQEEFRGLVKRLKELQEANPGIVWFGQYGTAGVLAIQDKMGGQPTRNYTEGTFAQSKDIDGAVLAKTILKERDTCYACVVKCKRTVEVRDPDLTVDPIYGGPEYETLTFFGSMCGVGDLKLLSKASADANMYGMDTISAGATIAWAIEAKEKGLLDDQGLGLAYGDGQSVLRAIEAIALRRGVGDLLAEGSLRAAQSLGPAAVDLHRHRQGPGAAGPHAPAQALSRPDLRREPLRRRPSVLRARLRAAGQARQPPAPAAWARSEWPRTSTFAISPTPRCASPIARRPFTLRSTPSASASSCGGRRGSSTGRRRRWSWSSRAPAGTPPWRS